MQKNIFSKFKLLLAASCCCIILSACESDAKQVVEAAPVEAPKPTPVVAVADDKKADPMPVQGMKWMPAGRLERDGKVIDFAGFYVDETEVTVSQFRQFVKANAFETEAEAYGWSGVFNRKTQTWDPVTGATWQYPTGPDGPKAKDNEPVTQVSWKDITAFALWAGKRIPTEDEWLWAASQGGEQKFLNWGDELLPDGKFMGNWWQGIFPYEDTGDDGFLGIAPVKSFPPDANGLYDIGGNVWEWTNDLRNPNEQANPNPEMVIKGGSFLCADNYCAGYELDSHQFTPKDSGLNHLGFRCIKD